MLTQLAAVSARCLRTGFQLNILKSRSMLSESACRSRLSSLAKPSREKSSLLSCIRCNAQQLLRGSSSAAAEAPLKGQKAVGTWLLTCAGMCFGAVVIGGITRLTESGLSMTQWHLIKGMKPPRTDEEWASEFERYKQFPEYKYLERDLTLEGFKKIFFWEYTHRMWGRTIGLVFALPAMYFLRKGYISKAMKPRLGIYFGLLVGQGLLGWYMVKSGLKDKANEHEIPRVSQYRLASHLGSAFVLYALFLWQGLSHLLAPHQLPNTSQIALLRKLAHSSMLAVFITAISGAFVAGMDAGLVYNSWPKMADRWIPSDLLAIDPKWKNIFENATTVQFNHRHLAEATGTFLLGIWAYSRRLPLPPRARMAANALGVMSLVQVGLGVWTLLSFVPTHLAATHQGGSLVLLSFAIWLTHELRRFPK